MSDSSPVLRVASARAALTTEALSQIPATALVQWLSKRRWFGAKGGPTRAVRFTRVTGLPWEDGAWAIAELATESDAGWARWQVPIAVLFDVMDDRDDEPIAVLELHDGPNRGLLVDATRDPRFLRHLADAFTPPTDEPGRHGSIVTGDHVRWIAETLGHEAFVVPSNARVRVASGEQSNTSILIGDVAILKLFRRLEAGEHPDVEVTRFLTLDAGFAYTPTLLGVIRLEDAAGEPTVAGMLQEFLPNSVDAWKWTLDAGREYFERSDSEGASRPGGPPQQQNTPASNDQRNQSAAPVTDSPPKSGTTPINHYNAAADRLGVITRAMHEAFASDAAKKLPSFAPERVTAEELASWSARVETQLVDAIGLLERQLQSGGVLSPYIALAHQVVERRDAYCSFVRRVASEVTDAGCLVRHHGDYHLGQVLRTAGDDFMVIDFEGEPTRPLADRRRKQSALRDVAGMLRSFAYAASTLAVEHGKALDEDTRRARADSWEEEAREAFLRGYLRVPVTAVAEGREHVSDPGFLPGDPADVKRLMTLFEMEKVFYELAYELNNRPEWVWIPLHGIAKVSS